ncbi:MAG TPA: choline-sulfatase [Steroidobacteraceae bacterium]|nr:choline-sulfatase [Steroidobacteraceae bacterium]
MGQTPNLLILMADQLAPRMLPAYGGSVARTPHIDALARAGVVFESFYCNSPLCAPSRFSFMAGQLPSKIGAYDNAAEFPAQVPTFAHYLRAAGYQTALSGKMHFCGPDQLHGFEDRLTTDIYPADFGWTPDWSRFAERPGWYHTMESVITAGACTRTNQIDFDDEVVAAARQKLFDIARSKDSRPFCLVVSMTHPHDPYVIPTAYWNRYRDEEIDLPRVPDLAGREDPHSTRLRHVIGLDLAKPSTAQIRAARRAYCGAVSYVDDQIGSMINTLKEAELDRNTVTVLLADHGDMLGERGLWYKMSFYEGACRIPLIVHAPGRFAPRRVTAVASLLDLLPTFAALANGGAEPAYAAPIDGHNLLPQLAANAPERNAAEVVGEYLAEGAIAPIIMIRRGRHKYVHSPADPDQLYDLESDPDERKNLATDLGFAEAIAQFRTEVARRWSLPELHEAVLASQRRRHFVYTTLRQGEQHPWDFQPRRDASRLYIRNDQELNDLERMARFPRLA